MIISFNKKLVDGPYGGGNVFLRLFRDFLINKGHNVVFDLNRSVDIIFLVDVRDDTCVYSIKDVSNYKIKNKNIKVIHRINENSAHRGSNNKLDNILINTNNQLSDFTVYISDYLKLYFKNKGLDNKSVVIYNGCDRSMYYPDLNKDIRKKTDKIKIITHHWSDNILKGFDLYKKVDAYCRNNDKFDFWYMGRFPEGYIRYGNIIGTKVYKEIPSVLKKCDVYLTASQYEPGGYHVAEGLSCGLIPVVLDKSGGCVDYTKGFNITYSNYEEFILKINELYNNYNSFLDYYNKVLNYNYSSNDMCNKYFEVINGI